MNNTVIFEKTGIVRYGMSSDKILSEKYTVQLVINPKTIFNKHKYKIKFINSDGIDINVPESISLDSKVNGIKFIKSLQDKYDRVKIKYEEELENGNTIIQQIENKELRRLNMSMTITVGEYEGLLKEIDTLKNKIKEIERLIY